MGGRGTALGNFWHHTLHLVQFYVIWRQGDLREKVLSRVGLYMIHLERFLWGMLEPSMSLRGCEIAKIIFEGYISYIPHPPILNSITAATYRALLRSRFTLSNIGFSWASWSTVIQKVHVSIPISDWGFSCVPQSIRQMLNCVRTTGHVRFLPTSFRLTLWKTMESKLSHILIIVSVLYYCPMLRNASLHCISTSLDNSPPTPTLHRHLSYALSLKRVQLVAICSDFIQNISQTNTSNRCETNLLLASGLPCENSIIRLN